MSPHLVTLSIVAQHCKVRLRTRQCRDLEPFPPPNLHGFTRLVSSHSRSARLLSCLLQRRECPNGDGKKGVYPRLFVDSAALWHALLIPPQFCGQAHARSGGPVYRGRNDEAAQMANQMERQDRGAMKAKVSFL